MLKYLLLAISTSVATLNFAQPNININNIEIVRDSYGIPHIFTKTDVEAVYGIAWAQCEDNFNIMQDSFAASKGLSGRLIGAKGAALDFLYQVFEIDQFVESRYQKDITPEIENMLFAYAAALNKYAATHPKEIKSKKLFPITPKKILGGHTLQTLLLHNSLMELGKIMTKKFEYDALKDKILGGSNAFAFNKNITADAKSYLIGNPHQPVNDMGNFWEASVHSEEGYEMYGVTFSIGGLFLVIGSNKNLGWSHTTNYHNTADVYQLQMHPTKKNSYKYDGQWLNLKTKKVKLKVKIGPIVIPVTKNYFSSVYGAVFKKKTGYYAYKTAGLHNLKVVEQWYKMGKAKSFKEFKKALDIQGLPYQTITYADRDNNIYHLSNFVHPIRNEEYDYTLILDGNTSKNNWNFNKYYPVSSLPQVKNPICGYVYNCNNTVFKMTGAGENPKPEDFPKSFGLLTSNNVRANTLEKLISEYETISFNEARKIRENVTVDKLNLSLRNCMNCSDIPLILEKNKKLKPFKEVFDKWNGSFDVNNKQAAAMVIASMYFEKYITEEFGNVEKDVPEAELEKAMLKAQKFLLKHYGTLEVELGELQKAVRADVEMPMYGGPSTLANCHVKPYKKGKVKIESGDSFVFYAKYNKEGLEELHTINAFGNSMKEESPYHTNQTEMYVQKQTKKIELDLKKLKASGKIYHPQ